MTIKQFNDQILRWNSFLVHPHTGEPGETQTMVELETDKTYRLEVRSVLSGSHGTAVGFRIERA